MKTKITENLLGNKAIAEAWLQPPAKHTPGPLRLSVFTRPRNGSLSGTGLELRDANSGGTLFIAAWNGEMEREGLAIAERIGAAVNSHADLLEAAWAVYNSDNAEDSQHRVVIRLTQKQFFALKAAIAKAEGR